MHIIPGGPQLALPVGNVVRKVNEIGSAMVNPRSGQANVSDEIKETAIAKFHSSSKNLFAGHPLSWVFPKLPSVVS